MGRSVRLVVLLVIASLIAGLAVYTAASRHHQLTSHNNVVAVDNSPVVYITNTGTKYHRGDCQYLSMSKIKTTMSQVEEDRYTPCKVCKP